jgi:PHP family Zn ribbon phosphoesterase
MRYWIDLHIHSCLSPCADDDMTPNNIVNMALIKGLDIIAITDHNSVKNAGSIIEAGKRAGIAVIPGMELCTSEEIHLICLFPDLNSSREFEKIVYANLSPLMNREDIFGPQIIMDSSDQVIGREDKLLSGACGLDTETALKLVRNLGGTVIPAHINRESFSMLNTLGAIPDEYGFKFIECSKNCIVDNFLREHPQLSSYKFLTSSDAHFLSNILEQEVSLELHEKSAQALLSVLNASGDGS